ncbi:glycosyltransferase family 2 protein [Clostridium sp. C105KSO13]|uniref:glycosyltransferase family 2 protein n=1 Tax=Clostridium sp. C105KSO13 TaxID=1776045 RepID=UPI0007407764|nr:glycosyltransferase family 2 protein [Clostridium sp. C105KSO13]CUX34418.1 N-glycosyltransferase [Clostridium sp. C105KSO13]
MKQVSFVILHFMDLDTTVACIASIINNISYENYKIIVVDNGSTNDSEKRIEEKYDSEPKVILLCANENLGFAKGNNLGYSYAKKMLNADYIIITNNDTIFKQHNYIDIMISEFEKNNCYLIGPDLITPDGYHQNPHRDHILTQNEVRKMLLIKAIFLHYFMLKKTLHLDKKINALEYLYDKKDEKTHENINYKQRKENVVLQGACLIFTPIYISRETEAFSPKTFMYGEEDLLAYKCQRNGYKIVYSPELKTFHMQGVATGKAYEKKLEKNIFMYKYIVEGCQILLKEMKNDRN